MKNDLLLIFAREPVPGLVKTRLAKDVGFQKAALLYDLILHHVIDGVTWPHYDIVIYKTPESSLAFFEAILPSAVIRNQPEGDLGKRISAAFKSEFARGYTRICLTGTDCPGISSSDILQAFDLLGHFELVLGPSSDGGYYLVGLSVFHPELFEGIAWGTDTVFTETVRTASFLGIDYGCLPEMSDIDDITGLKEYMSNNPSTDLSLAFAKALQKSL